MKNILQATGLVIGTIMLLDFLGFWLWIISGQTPIDSVFIGSITAHIIKLFI